MAQYNEILIHKSSSIREALELLNRVHTAGMTLFVTDDAGRMVGTLTDGDIRRALIKGCNLENRVEEAMYRSFRYLNETVDIKKLREFKESRIPLIPVLDKNGRIKEIIDLTKFKSCLPIDAVLMAGGKGERLRPLTLTTPKPLLKIGSRAIIDTNVESLAEYGVKNISVTVNYLKEQLIDHYKKPTKDGITVECVEEEQFFGTIGALKLIKNFHNEYILVMNSDLLTNIDYEDFFIHFIENDAMMSVAAVPYTISVPYGILELNGREITEVREKPIYNLYANAGIYLIKREALEFIPTGVVFNATDLITTLVKEGHRVIRYPLSGLWIDIGTPEEYKKSQELVKHLNKNS